MKIEKMLLILLITTVVLFTFTCVKNNTSNSVVGKWSVIFNNKGVSNKEDSVKQEITFYTNNTSLSENIRSGKIAYRVSLNYKIVDDGRVIVLQSSGGETIDSMRILTITNDTLKFRSEIDTSMLILARLK